MSRAVMRLPDTDFGGEKPRAEELITTETIGLMRTKALNSELMTVDDELYQEYVEFLANANVSATPIDTIGDENLGRGAGYFDDVDMSGQETLVDFVAVPNYFMQVPIWAAGPLGSTYHPPEAKTSIFDEVTKLKDGEYIFSDFKYEPEIYAGDLKVV